MLWRRKGWILKQHYGMSLVRTLWIRIASLTARRAQTVCCMLALSSSYGSGLAGLAACSIKRHSFFSHVLTACAKSLPSPTP
ncbi:uncharacterized protein BDR25DRAFT_355061 [Lindgomyces ingoldianus]|uniref:Uncharacterized protein n=1 Tax=Lindgomyces ingoldianus TaxID=673940 RepID=A0ACB6QWW1_9PLEO|nr:uncharacterized protein BDR25DRAFT_355061 [Lindgomyces ingoldianus]KAF2470570.1 hypothetical protein BDR25DRAFT_355061 [Lindgomyces ingoldianus]